MKNYILLVAFWVITISCPQKSVAQTTEDQFPTVDTVATDKKIEKGIAEIIRLIETKKIGKKVNHKIEIWDPQPYEWGSSNYMYLTYYKTGEKVFCTCEFRTKKQKKDNKKDWYLSIQYWIYRLKK